MQHSYGGTAMPGAVHQIEKGTMGWDPNRPREDPSPLLLPAYSFSRTFRDQRPTHSKRDSDRDTEIQTDGPKKGRGRKDAMRRKNPCGLPVITQTPGFLLRAKNNHRLPGEHLRNIHWESGQPPPSGAPWSIFLPQLHPIMLRFCSVKIIYNTLKKHPLFSKE